MKKIFLSFLFVAFTITMNAQNITDRQTIKENSNNLIEYVNEDIAVLKNNFGDITETHEKNLTDILYYKYKTLTSDLSSEELTDLTNSLKERIKIILGDQLYLKVSENKDVFYRITGLVYLTQ